jgi:PKD repeat protein
MSFPTQTGNTFSGTATGTFDLGGLTATEYIQLDGTITESGQVSGTTSHTFLGTGGEGTFTGQLNGNTLTIENPGHDTYGETCTYTRYMTATREGDLTPSANFSANPTCGHAPLSVDFTDESVGAITSRTWNFGDGASSVIQNPSHTYTNEGKYSVSLTVSGPSGSDSETKIDYIFIGKVSKLESTFDEGDEGWWIYGDGTNLTYHNNGGNPGGYISAEDLALDATWRFVSPCTWGGDWSSFLGGTISFDLKLISGDTSNYYTAADVIIDTEGTGHHAKWSSGINPKIGTWTHYEVRLSESNFEIVGDRTWDQIISNVTYLFIRGEHIVGPDTEGVDNIRVVKGRRIINPHKYLLLLGE